MRHIAIILFFLTNIVHCMETEQNRLSKVMDQIPVEVWLQIFDIKPGKNIQFPGMLNILRMMRVNKNFHRIISKVYAKKLENNREDLKKTIKGRQEYYEKMASVIEGKIDMFIAIKEDLLFWMHNHFKKEAIRNAVVNEPIFGNQQPFFFAIDHNAKNIARLLIKTNINFNQEDPAHHFSPFKYALTSQNQEIAMSLAKEEFKRTDNLVKLQYLAEFAEYQYFYSVAEKLKAIIKKHTSTLGQ